MKKQFKFKEIHDEIELEKFLKLRYQTFLNSSMKNFLNLNKHQIDIDIYDLQSRHFGLYCENKPAGFLRIVYPKQEIYQNYIFNLGCKYTIYNPNKHNKTAIKHLDYPDFPFISYPKVPNSIQNYYNTLNIKNEKLVEPSRLMLFQNVSGVSKTMFLTECAIVLYVLICIGKKHAVINCDVRHERFYKRYGFQKINNEEETTYHLKDRKSRSSSLLTLSLAESLRSSPVSKAHHNTIENMLEEFNNTNEITRVI